MRERSVEVMNGSVVSSAILVCLGPFDSQFLVNKAFDFVINLLRDVRLGYRASEKGVTGRSNFPNFVSSSALSVTHSPVWAAIHRSSTV